MTATTNPFDDIRALFSALPPADEAQFAVARARQAELTKPSGSLGRLEEVAEFLASWQGGKPHVDSPLVAVFAGNHGVVAKGVSPFPASVTQAMVANFTHGGAAINQICKTFDISLKVYELALEHPTGDITEEAAMDERNCAATIAFGQGMSMDNMDWTEELFDYGNQLGVAAACIYGLKKSRYNSADYGTVLMNSYPA